ncbi:MAG TPA: hypothetical protein VL485_24870 [Ktedonobacteraceae bacterium]|nr:hypothetical protein [Ktedonobacteraceae bacterium]
MRNEWRDYMVHQSDKYCAIALISLTMALFFLSVLVFTFAPTTLLGILSIGIGVLLMIVCIVSFAFYHRAIKQEEKSYPKF